jgi:REP element-mobilizing transposase RayT
LRGFNYAGPATYFVTICSNERRQCFGKVDQRKMHPSKWGIVAEHEWGVSLARRPFILAHAFIVMPHHVHGLISFDPTELSSADRDAIAQGLPPGSLGALLNRYKGAVTTIIRRFINQPLFDVWQGNYHDRIVRDQQEFDTVLEYIRDNPARWEQDRFHPDRS